LRKHVLFDFINNRFAPVLVRCLDLQQARKEMSSRSVIDAFAFQLNNIITLARYPFSADRNIPFGPFLSA
jgi:hypothetical protein